MQNSVCTHSGGSWQHLFLPKPVHWGVSCKRWYICKKLKMIYSAVFWKGRLRIFLLYFSSSIWVSWLKFYAELNFRSHCFLSYFVFFEKEWGERIWISFHCFTPDLVLCEEKDIISLSDPCPVKQMQFSRISDG